MVIGNGSVLGHYVIAQEIGRGGMGVVYRAHDTRLDRDVALKVLPAGFAADSDELARFEREAKLLAALNHPNILFVLDVGKAGETSYFVMELLRGGTLRERFHGRTAPWRKAVAIAAELAEGLAAAHARGVTHRDLKPDNVFLTDDEVVKILDFGLARSSGGEAASEALTLTEVGTIMGTPGYMAPEQVKGETADSRSDIFALGCLLHELIAGDGAFRRDTPAESIAAVLSDEPPSVLDGAGDIPSDLDRLIRRCLEKDPRHRFQSARDLAFTLRGLLAAPAATPLAGTSAGEPAAEDTPSIAVLPFANMSGDPENEYFSDGVAEEIINALAQLRGLHVVGRTSAFSFKGKDEDLRTIADRLGVRTILEGSVRKAGGRVRVTAKLVNAMDGYQLWSERFDRDLEDIFEVQDEIARAIVDKLQVTLGQKAGDRLVESHTKVPEAYQSYVKGRALLLQRGPVLWRALEALRAATTHDPGYAQAWAGVAEAYAVIGYFGLLPPREALGMADIMVQKAMELGPNLAESHCAAAIVNHVLKWDWDAAEMHYRRSIELNPRFVQARSWYGFFFLQLLRGRYEEGAAMARQALADDPLSAYSQAILAFTLGFAGQTDEAVTTARRAVAQEPNSFVCNYALESCYTFAGRFDETVAHANQMHEIFSRHPWTLHMQAVALARLGKAQEAADIYREIEGRAAAEFVQPMLLAIVAVALGRRDDSRRHFERALDEKDPYLAFSVLGWPHVWTPPDEPWWADVLHRMGLS